MPLPSLGRMWIISKRYPPEQRARAVKMVLDHLAEYRSVYAACQAIGPKVGVGVESHETRSSAAGWSEEANTAPLRYVRGATWTPCAVSTMVRRPVARGFHV